MSTDIEQRIADARARTTEPRITVTDTGFPKGGLILGEMPVPLRHLHNLLSELDPQEVLAIQHVHEVLFADIEAHLPRGNCIAVVLRPDWTVIGIVPKTELSPQLFRKSNDV